MQLVVLSSPDVAKYAISLASHHNNPLSKDVGLVFPAFLALVH
jgi:hypothetical protein